ncbi:MAG TPA: hypothetical protein VFV68_01990 [Agriterribacter sp.]|nr:hypothetical protein [Agriterribacter sp.]
MKKIIFFSLSFIVLTAFAQNKAQPAPTTAALPHIAITIGGFKGGDITSEIFSRIIDSTLTARDEKGNKYYIVRFRSIYKFKSSYEDSETGQRKVTDDMRVNDFKDTDRMSELWRQSIKDNIAKGDEMILDNIIVQLKNGSKIMAPVLSFKMIQ